MSVNPEPTVVSWEPLDERELYARLLPLMSAAGKALVLVDGRSGSGKSTFAERLARVFDGAVVHTDDVAWHHDEFDWADLLVAGVLDPWRAGRAVRYRPPGWIAKHRQGAVEVPRRRVLVVEGVGAGRACLADLADLVVWVQSDRQEARRRGLARDVQLGRTSAEAEAFWDEWMRAEEPFLACDRPWTRARLIVNGTPPLGSDGSMQVASGPLG